MSARKTILVSLAVAVGAAASGVAGFAAYRDYQQRNQAAWQLGFADNDDMTLARKQGFKTAALWQIEQDRRSASLDAEKQMTKAADARAKTAADEKKRVDEERFQTAVRGALALRASMKNPDSFQLGDVLRMPDGSLCYEYRATNSFNAIVPGHAVISQHRTSVSGNDDFPAQWAKHCNGYGVVIRDVASALSYHPRQ